MFANMTSGELLAGKTTLSVYIESLLHNIKPPPLTKNKPQPINNQPQQNQ